MTIDYLSDLHFDYYFNMQFPLSTSTVKSLFDGILLNEGKREPADVLIIAGDLGHYNEQNIEILKIIQKEYYKHIVCVLGNHDYYLTNRSQKDDYKMSSFARAEEMRKLINECDNIYCLDGDVIEIDGVKFGGAMGWYNDSYLRHYYGEFSQKSNNNMWQNINQDSDFLYGVKNYDDLYKIEYPKLEKIYKECDVIITHINPSYLHEHISEKYHNQQGNTFFTFDGHKLIKEGSMQYWIYGHSHDSVEYELFDTKVLCNPMGYPNENNYGDDICIKSFEVRR